MAKALPIYAVRSDGLLAENASLMLHTRLEEMYSWSKQIADPARIQDLHNMRIAAKRLRYTLEIFAPCFPEKECKWLTDHVKSIQEQIGEIHDADVRGPLFQNFVAEHAAKRPEIRVGLEHMAQAEQAERAKQYRKFLAFWNKLDQQGFKSRFMQFLAQTPPASPREKENTDDESVGQAPAGE